MKYYFLLVLYSVVFSSTAQSSSFQITYNGATPQAKIAIDRAAEIWSNILVSSVPIKVNVNWVNATSLGFLGVSISNGVKDFPNAPFSDVWYPSSLADALAGTDLIPTETDMDVYLDSSRNWYFGIDGNGPGNQFDLVNVALHEFGHGLGFYSIANIDGAGIGSFSLVIDPSTSLLASFPIPNLAGKPLIFDLFVENLQGELLVDTNLFLNPSLGLANQFSSNNLFFNGLNAMNAHNNNRPKLYAPGAFSFGSSILHLDETAFSPHTNDAVMTPYCSPGESNLNPGPVTIGILQDLGWVINPTFIDEQIVKNSHKLSIYPNPVSGNATLTYELNKNQHVNISIYNLQGQKITTLVDEKLSIGVYNTQVVVNQLSGLYFVVQESLDRSSITKFMVK
jgi:large repetitive protein